MKLFAKILSENEVHLAREGTQDGEGWYEIEREPLLDESLVHDTETGMIKIVPRVKTTDEIAAESKARGDAELMKADTIRDLQARVAELEKRITAIDKGSTA